MTKDIAHYGIRVIRPNNGLAFASGSVSSKKPVDIPGTVLLLALDSGTARRAWDNKNWFDLLFGELSVFARVRWDNDYKSTFHISDLAILSTGKLPMYWPIDAPSKEAFAHRFDFRPAADRVPMTCSKSTKNTYMDYYTNAKQEDFKLKLSKEFHANYSIDLAVKTAAKLNGTFSTYLKTTSKQVTTKRSSSGSLGAIDPTSSSIANETSTDEHDLNKYHYFNSYSQSWYTSS